MTIMFDFDGTYAADLVVMRAVAETFKAAGHTLVMITARQECDRAFVEGIVDGIMPVLCAGASPKRAVACAAGYLVDVWIEDNPVMVDFGELGLQMVGFQH